MRLSEALMTADSMRCDGDLVVRTSIRKDQQMIEVQREHGVVAYLAPDQELVNLGTGEAEIILSNGGELKIKFLMLRPMAF